MAEVYRKGDGVHYRFNGDSYPATVTRATKTRVWVRQDRVRVSGESKLFIPKEEGAERLFTLRDDGEFRSSGHGVWILGRGRESHWAKEL